MFRRPKGNPDSVGSSAPGFVIVWNNRAVTTLVQTGGYGDRKANNYTRINVFEQNLIAYLRGWKMSQ